MSPADRAGDEGGFRPDVEGMRGLAVALVVLFHARLLGVVGGFVGVDVFFVISGFLITGLLLRERERSGRIGFRGFYARRVRRLAPAALVVLAVVLPLSYLIVNPLDRADALLDGAASALSVGNIRFAAAAGDYFASVSSPSPFLHFWSLGVEEQFYLLWPVLLLLAARGPNPRRGVGITLAALAGISFAANVWLTDASVNWAFYSLPTRAWELALGGLLAVAGVRLATLPARPMSALGWVGLAAVVGGAYVIDPTVPYPGAAALLPVLGAAALIAAGARGGGPARLLTVRPMRALGRISYSLYLWHWPILVLPVIAVGADLGLLQTLILVALSVAVAGLSWRFVEEPFRRGLPALARRPGLAVATGLTAMVLIALVGTGAAWRASSQLATLGASDDESVLVAGGAGSQPTPPPGDPFGSDGLTIPSPAEAVTPPPSGTASAPTAHATVRPGTAPVSYALPADVRPRPGGARADTTEGQLRADSCIALDAVSVPPDCVYGDPSGSFTVALVGDSHAAQFFPTLQAVAAERHWRILTFLKVRCSFLDMRLDNPARKREYTECEAWNHAVIARLKAAQPALILINFSRFAIHPMNAADASLAAQAAAWSRLVEQLPGRVALIVDTPYGGQDVPVCLAAHLPDIRPCWFSHATAMTGSPGVREAAVAGATGAGLIDLNAEICAADPCSPIPHRILLFRDDNHITLTYAKYLIPAFRRAVDAVLPSAATAGPGLAQAGLQWQRL